MFVQLRPLPTDKTQHEIKFTTVWDGARGVVEEQNQAQFFLGDEAISKLKQLLNSY